MLEVSQFPLCCGLSVVTGFSFAAPSFYNPNILAHQELIEENVAQLETIITNHAHLSGVLLSLNQNQRQVYKRHIYRLGFRRLGYGFNGGHSSTIYLYGRFNSHERMEDPRDADRAYAEALAQ